MGRAKVCYVVPALGQRGTTRLAQCLAVFLDTDAFEFSVLTFKAPPEGVLPSEVQFSSVSGEMPAWARVRLVRGLVYAYRLHAVLRRECPDVVIGDVTWLCNALVVARLLTGVPRRLLVRMGNIKSRAWSNDVGPVTGWFRRKVTGALFSRADVVIVPSQAAKDDVVERLGVGAERVTVIPNPIDLERVSERAQEAVDDAFAAGCGVTILAVGVLNEQKNHALLVEAFARLAKEKGACLVLVGGGPERRRLERLAGELGVSQRVLFTGSVANPYKYMAQATVFVHPARWEGFGYAVLEAMACGRPVVAGAGSGGPAELVRDGVDGLLVDDMSPECLAQAISKLLNDAALRTALGKNAAKRAREYDANVVVPAYEKLIAEQVERSRVSVR